MPIFEFILPILLLIGIAYGIIPRIQTTIMIRKQFRQGDKRIKKLFVGYCLSLIGMIGFFICFLISVVIHSLLSYTILMPSIISNELANAGCLISLILFFTAQYGIISKESKKHVRLT